MNHQSADNGQSDLDTIIERVAPELKAQFLQDRLRLSEFGEHDEILAISRYLGTTVILMERITENIPEAQTKALTPFLESLATASRNFVIAVRQQSDENRQTAKVINQTIQELRQEVKDTKRMTTDLKHVRERLLYAGGIILFLAGLLFYPLVLWMRQLAPF